MKYRVWWVAWLGLGVLLGACGYKGDLYLPGQEPPGKSRHSSSPANP